MTTRWCAIVGMVVLVGTASAAAQELPVTDLAARARAIVSARDQALAAVRRDAYERTDEYETRWRRTALEAGDREADAWRRQCPSKIAAIGRGAYDPDRDRLTVLGLPSGLPFGAPDDPVVRRSAEGYAIKVSVPFDRESARNLGLASRAEVGVALTIECLAGRPADAMTAPMLLVRTRRLEVILFDGAGKTPSVVFQKTY